MPAFSAPAAAASSESPPKASGALIGAQILLDGGTEAELRFRADSFLVDSGCLVILDKGEAGALSPIAAFSAGSWRGAWRIDPSSESPVGLDPLSRPHASLADFRALSLLLQTLSVHPYSTLESLASEMGVPASDAERVALAAIQERLVDSSLLSDKRVQALLDERLPKALQQARPADKSLSSLLPLARAIEGLEAVDAIQLRVWISRRKSVSS